MEDELGFFRVVGVSHYQEALERCSAGEIVGIVHEPDNPFDEMALRVIAVSGETIGYVPRNSWLRQMIHEKGRGASGSIASIGYGRSCLIGATISVAVCDDDVRIESYYPGQPAPERPKLGFRHWVRTPSGVGQREAARI